MNRSAFQTAVRTWGILAALLSVWAPARAELDLDRFERDVRALAASDARVVGSPGYQASVAYVKSQISPLKNVEWREQTWRLMVPITKRAELTYTAPDGTRTVAAIHPFWPASVRVNSTPPQGITGQLVYIGDARYEQIPAGELMGQIAVVESTAGAAWTQAFYFGARALIVLGGPNVNNADLRHHDLLIPIHLPRFYIPDGPLAEHLRGGRIKEPATLYAKVSWEQVEATNIYALVRPQWLKAFDRVPAAARLVTARTVNLGLPGWSGVGNPPAMLITAPLDASALVPGQSTGASQAVQTAAALELLRDLDRRPLNRPVMVAFVSGDNIQLRGTRELLMTLADPPGHWRAELDEGDGYTASLTRQEAELARDLARARAVLADPSRLSVASDRSVIERIGKIVELDATLCQDELFRIRIRPKSELTDELRARDRELETRRIDLNALGFVLQQEPALLGRTWLPSARTPEQVRQEIGGRRLPPPTSEADSLLPMARQYVQRAIDRMEQLQRDLRARRAHLENRIELYQWLAGLIHRDADPDRRSNNSRLIDTMIPLDLSDRGVRVGPMVWGYYYRTSSLTQVLDWREWFDRQRSQPWLQQVRGAFTGEPISVSGVRAPQSWLAAPLALASEVGVVWGVPSFTMMTLDDMRLVRDTPADTLANLNLAAIRPQLAAVHKVLWRAFDDPELRTQAEYKWQRNGYRGQVVSPAVGRPVPDLPRENFVATYYYVEDRKMPRVRNVPWTMGVRRNEVVATNAEGQYRLEGLLMGDLSEPAREYLIVASQVFSFAEDGSIMFASDAGRQTTDIRIVVDLRQELPPIRSLVFACEELPLVGLYDPRFLQDLGELTLLDARRNAEPQRFNYFLVRQMLAGFVEPGQRVNLLFRYGRAGNRLILLNSDLQERRGAPVAIARGLTAQDARELGPPALATARDFHNVDRERLTEYASKGVKSDLIDTLHATAGQQLADSQAALASNDTPAFVRHVTGAWANEARVYLATLWMANDVIRAAIFLLLLCIPFAFCIERLLIGTPNIYRQIAGAAGIFAIMAVALASFHPAFRISTSPLIIILAFAIIFMSCVVIWVVYSKFDTELKRLSSGRGSAATTSFARASVLMSAVLLGIANMRRRRFRTALTAVTVVLITFAVLAFTSASRYVGVTTLPTGVPKQESGIMLRQRGFRPIPHVTIENLRAVLHTPGAIDASVPGHRQIVERWWNVDATENRNHIHITALDPPPAPSPTGEVPAAGATLSLRPDVERTTNVVALLGISPGEWHLSAMKDVIPDGRLRLLEDGRQDVIYFSQDVAARLNVFDNGQVRPVRVGDRVRVGGIDLEVAGIYNAIQFDTRVTALSGEPVTPLNYLPDALDAGGRKLRDAGTDDLMLEAEDTAAELGNIYEHLSSSQIAIVPAAASRLLPNASLRGLTIRLRNQEEVEQVGRDLARRYAMAMFAAYDDGVRLMAASNLTDVKGGTAVAIPLAIAGLIIFNTMMGSIAERRREIHVYTSLGLAPVHVGALFLAEAMTYGLIGTVFGYVIGQGAGKLLYEAGWLGEVTLNYSGTSAMMTMGLILVIVLLSALVPARLASRIAAPSIERTWRVPMPRGDEIVAELPFTINRTAAEGVIAYLAEWFDAHQEGSIGKFSADRVEFFQFADESGRVSRGLKTVVWLTPFDLGVRQHLMLLIHPGVYEDIYEVQLVLQRLSGDDGSWYRMNRSFLTQLRQQFLQWRSLMPQRMAQYVAESRRMFEREAEGASVRS